MLKLYTYNITSPDKGFYSLSLSGIKSAIGCEKVIPRSDSKLLDLHVWLGVEALIKSSTGQRRIVNAGRSCDAHCSLAFTNFITKKGEIYEKLRRNLSKDS